MESKIPLVEIIHHKFHGKQDSTVDQFMENTFSTKSTENCIPQNLWKLKWKIIFHKFHGKQDFTVDELMENTFSTKSMENCIPQNLWKLKWKMILHKFH